MSCPRPGPRARPDRLLPEPAALTQSFPVPAGLEGRLLGDRLGSVSPRSTWGAPAGSADLEAERQDEHSGRRRAVSRRSRASRTPSGWRADAWGLQPSTSARRQDVEIREFGRVRGSASARHALGRLGISPAARHRGEGRQGEPYAQTTRRGGEELGADVVSSTSRRRTRARARTLPLLREDAPARLRRVVRSAGGDGPLLRRREAGRRRGRAAQGEALHGVRATGVMFGRNMWLRGFDEALALTEGPHDPGPLPR